MSTAPFQVPCQGATTPHSSEASAELCPASAVALLHLISTLRLFISSFNAAILSSDEEPLVSRLPSIPFWSSRQAMISPRADDPPLGVRFNTKPGRGGPGQPPPTLRKTFSTPSFPRRKPYRIAISFGHSRPVCMLNKGLQQRSLGAARTLNQSVVSKVVSGLPLVLLLHSHGSAMSLCKPDGPLSTARHVYAVPLSRYNPLLPSPSGIPSGIPSAGGDGAGLADVCPAVWRGVKHSIRLSSIRIPSKQGQYSRQTKCAVLVSRWRSSSRLGDAPAPAPVDLSHLNIETNRTGHFHLEQIKQVAP